MNIKWRSVLYSSLGADTNALTTGQLDMHYVLQSQCFGDIVNRQLMRYPLSRSISGINRHVYIDRPFSSAQIPPSPRRKLASVYLLSICPQPPASGPWSVLDDTPGCDGAPHLLQKARQASNLLFPTDYQCYFCRWSYLNHVCQSDLRLRCIQLSSSFTLHARSFGTPTSEYLDAFNHAPASISRYSVPTLA